MNTSLIARLTLALAALSLTLLMPLRVARAADASTAAKPRFGVVDMQSIILKVDEGKKARADLEKEIKAKESEFAKQKAELEKMNEEFGKQQGLMSADAKMKKQAEFQERAMALMSAEREFQSQIKSKEQRATQKIAMKIAGIAEKLATDLGLDAVFESQNSGLVYLRDPIDLTDKVIAAYKNAPASGK